MSISTAGGKGAISEAKGDGSGTVNHYNGLDLQCDSREKAEGGGESPATGNQALRRKGLVFPANAPGGP